MKTLLDKQECVRGLISRTVINLKKLGKSNITKGTIRARIDQLETYWKTMQDIHEALLELKDPKVRDEPYFKDNHFEDAAEEYVNIKGELLDLLEESTLQTLTDNANSTNKDGQNSFDRSFSAGSNQMLPRIKYVPRFSERLHYLKLSLTDEAEQLLKNLGTTDSNYKIAWDQLVSRYENKRLIIHSYLHQLTSMPAIQTESASELKRLYDGTNEIIRALENLDRPVDSWDDWLVHITVERLDSNSRRDWEKSVSQTVDPITYYATLKTFMEGRVRELEVLDSTNSTSSEKLRSTRSKTYTTITKENLCAECDGKHFVLFCALFRKKSPEQRRELIAKKMHCYNCFSSHHLLKNCSSIKRCQHCGSKHHSMLHDAFTTKAKNNSTDSEAKRETIPTASTTAHHIKNSRYSSTILLATAMVYLHSNNGRQTSARVLLDQGSESSFISESIVQLLHLPKRKTNITVTGLGTTRTATVRSMVTVRMQSQVNPDSQYEIDAFVLPRLTAFLPSASTQDISERMPHLIGLTFADPNFAKPGRIDLILGADVYSRIILQGVRRPPESQILSCPIAQHTSLGWVISGPVISDRQSSSYATCSLHCTINTELSQQLQVFWKIEEVNEVETKLTEEELACENHFASTHSRDKNGRYIVRLPFKEYYPPLSIQSSYQAAYRSLDRMQRKFSTEPEFAKLYKDFMTEYHDLGHMTYISEDMADHSRDLGYILPHHAVMKASSSSTKLRVVINGSQTTTTGASLNDYLLIGPKLQADLPTILLKWRMHAIVIGADITKMYRQIKVHTDDCEFQRILWRYSPENVVQQCRLLTVTYGTACAPYLALRTLQQLAHDEKEKFPLGSQIILNDMYIDDVFTGAETVEQCHEYQTQLIELLRAGGFTLRKWVSNHRELLKDIPHTDQESPIELTKTSEALTSVLGLCWQPDSDVFRLSVKLPTIVNRITKRSILSDVSKLFDPFGWFSPVIITAKVLMQSLWLLGSDWDEQLPDEVQRQWINFRTQLPSLENIRIKRWTGMQSSVNNLQIHGFSDASEQAYAAVLYLRVTTENNQVFITLLTAKTKVAPVKRVSIPRLELCAAVLLSRLLKKVQPIINMNCDTYLWTDSTVVLTWIKNHASRWKTFIANRVGTIQSLTTGTQWSHVQSAENPADCATRGLTPHELKNYSQWWNGPSWLTQSKPYWPVSTPSPSSDHIERRCITTHSVLLQYNHEWSKNMLHRYSNLNKLMRVAGYCTRFISNCQLPASDRYFGFLTSTELTNARRYWIIIVQQSAFYTDIQTLKTGQPLSTRSQLCKLKPFIDENDILRVGGRLQNAILSYDEKYPIILPQKSPFTDLIIRHGHHRMLHGGLQLTLSHIRRSYWIIGARSQVKSFIRNCRNCLPYQVKTNVPQMADLPAQRVQPSRPFLHTGLDYAGPILLRTTKGRGRAYKGYIALFVCLSTRAIHLETVSDYSTQSFIAALKRFTSRRGICLTLWSDHGTNFIGADNELRRLFQASSPQRIEIAELLANDGIDWKFIPPASPHFGGIWEAGVRSVKHHLRRVIGEHTLTFEEMSTLLAEIESCLNSRPIQALDDEPSSLTALTPGHFLIGGPICSMPEPSLLDVKPGRLNRWQLLRQMYEHFWTRWSSEYLTTLQARQKWRVTKYQVKIGDLALVIDERLPPSKWILARIVRVHPGQDKQIRVVTLKTSFATMVRPVAKLCLLPRATEDV